MTIVLYVLVTALLLLSPLRAETTYRNLGIEQGYSSKIEMGDVSNVRDLILDLGSAGPLAVEMLYERTTDTIFSQVLLRPTNQTTSDVIQAKEMPEEESPDYNVFLFENVPALSEVEGNYALHLTIDSKYPAIQFFVGIQNTTVNNTVTSEQIAMVQNWPWWITVAVMYGLWGMIFVVNLLIAIGIYLGKECRKKNTAAKGEIKLKAIRYSIFFAVASALLLLSLAIAIAAPWVSEGPYGVWSCCNYFARSPVDGLPDKSLQCDGNQDKPCFMNAHVDFTYRMTLLYVYIPAAILSLLLLPLTFWTCVIHVFKGLRLLKNARTFEPHVKFSIGVADT